MPNFCKRTVILAAALLGLCSGCTQMSNTRLKSPIELMHNVAFGRKGFTTSEYTGSEVARQWDMAKHAEALAKQQQAMQATSAGNASL